MIPTTMPITIHKRPSIHPFIRTRIPDPSGKLIVVNLRCRPNRGSRHDSYGCSTCAPSRVTIDRDANAAFFILIVNSNLESCNLSGVPRTDDRDAGIIGDIRRTYDGAVEPCTGILFGGIARTTATKLDYAVFSVEVIDPNLKSISPCPRC